jgi:hypothetical protein
MRRFAWLRLLGLLILCEGFSVRLSAQELQQPSACEEPPANVRMNDQLRELFIRLAGQSATLRKQCATIANASHLRVIIQYANRVLPYNCEAKATITRFEAGRLSVVIEIPVTTRYAELIAHEFEHVLEAIEGIDLAALAKVRGSGVTQIANNVFETARARQAGRRVGFEVTERRVVAREPQHEVMKP